MPKRNKNRGSDYFVCHYCDSPPTTWDHIVPKSLGGRDAWWNRVPACVPCNQAKQNAMPTCACVKCMAAVEAWRDGNRAAIPKVRYNRSV